MSNKNYAGNILYKSAKAIDYIVRKIDERTKLGKLNEDDPNAHVSIQADGARVWSY